MEQHYLERSEGTEHKFYALALDGVSLSVRYGRIGTPGQTQHKTFPTAEAASKEAGKKLAEKRKGGYADAVPGEREAKAVVRPLLKLPDLLKPDRATIEANLRPCIQLLRADTPAGPRGSKVGGIPYREQGQPWPTTPDGSVLAFLAQVNRAVQIQDVLEILDVAGQQHRLEACDRIAAPRRYTRFQGSPTPAQEGERSVPDQLSGQYGQG